MVDSAANGILQEVTKTPISVIGLGYMGTAIAKAFIQKGHPVSVWNRSLSKAAPLVALGGKACKTAEECIRASELVVSVATDYNAFRAIFTSIDQTAGTGRTVVDFGTGSPSQVRESVALAKQQSFDAYIHAAMLGYPTHVGVSNTAALYSGPTEAYKPIEAVLMALGRPVYLGENPDRAALQEVILNTAYYTMSAGYLQSMALLKRAGLWTPGSAETLTTESIFPVLDIAKHSLIDLARQIDKGEFTTDETGCRLGNHLSSVRNYVRTYEEMNVAPLGLKSFADAIEKRIMQGGQDEELSGIVDSL